MEWKVALKDRHSRVRRWFDGAIIVLIILSLIAFAVETLPDLPGWAAQTLRVFEVLLVSLFTLEYAIRIWIAERKLGFIFSFFGIIDLLAILPFYVATGMNLDLRSLRAFRLIRLIRVLKLARYSRAVQRFHRALAIAREELVLFFCVAVIMLYLAATGIYHFEHAVQPENFKSVFHGLWWALVTLTTVGYGDAVPITFGGRFFTFVILMIGIGVFSVPAGLLASALSVARIEEEQRGETQDREDA
jgi:voltage-gated potassium channel